MLLPIVCLALSAADPVPVPSRIEDVTVYPISALVRRSAAVPGPGTYLVRGLPHSLDPANVRVKCDRGAVVTVEVRSRLQEAASSERIEALRARLDAARRELRVAEDEVKTALNQVQFATEMLKIEATVQREDTRAGRPAPDAWEASWVYVTRKIAAARTAQREAELAFDAKSRAVKEIEQELGRLQSGEAVPVRDVLVAVEGAGTTRLDLEYLVGGTGWTPLYELRAASSLDKVTLAYRAQVRQQTGEDWDGVQLALSTAQPQRGAQGRDPDPIWLSLWAPEPPATATARPSRKAAGRLESLGYDSGEANKAADRAQAPQESFATVESQGLSVRFQLPRRETVQSRSEPTSVLIGQADLAAGAERYCSPALDTTVWLRGKAMNTSEWSLLPGQASVFLGQDFLGRADIDLVQPGQELTLHLGADPFLSVERTRTQDLAKGPGFLSSRASQVDGWRIQLKNHGAPTSAKDGAVDVIVREALPRSRDERISVEMTKAEPKVSADERWKQDREEKGIQTWVVRVPRGGETNIVWESTVSYPKDARVVSE